MAKLPEPSFLSSVLISILVIASAIGLWHVAGYLVDYFNIERIHVLGFIIGVYVLCILSVFIHLLRVQKDKPLNKRVI